MATSKEVQAFLASSGVLDALDRHYARIMERILNELAAGMSRPGAARARDLLLRIRQLSAELDPRRDTLVRTWIRERLPQAFILGDKAATRQLREALEKSSSEKRNEFGDINRAFSAVNSTALRAIVASMEDHLADVARQVYTTAAIAVRKTQLTLQQDAAVREAVTGGIIRGAAGREISNDIAAVVLAGKSSPEALKRLQERGFHQDTLELYKRLSQGQMVTVGKKTMNVRAYANLVARTMARQATSVATVVRLQQNGIDHVQVSKHRQKKADVCTLIAGQVFYIGPLPKDPLGFPSIKEIPGGEFPPHPNCSHVFQPYVAALKPAESVNQAKDVAGLIPRKFLGKTAGKVNELIGAMDAAALKKIAPIGFDHLEEPPEEGPPVPGKEKAA